MAVLINFKICDNVKECGGIAVCPTGSLSWDSKKKRIKTDNKKCISCGKCAKECSIGAIKVAKSTREFAQLKKEIAADPRKAKDLFVDRYGAQPVLPAFLTPEEKLDPKEFLPDKVTAVEFFNNDSINCLLLSIPIKEIVGDFAAKYRKVQIKNGGLLKKYRITVLPALLFFKGAKVIGHIAGYYGISDKIKFKQLISKFSGRK